MRSFLFGVPFSRVLPGVSLIQHGIENGAMIQPNFKFGLVGCFLGGHPERRAKPEVEGSLVGKGDPSTPPQAAPLRMTAHKWAKDRPQTAIFISTEYLQNGLQSKRGGKARKSLSVIRCFSASPTGRYRITLRFLLVEIGGSASAPRPPPSSARGEWPRRADSDKICRSQRSDPPRTPSPAEPS